MSGLSRRKRPYRVIQWGTGMVGTHALRAISERSDFELAGVFVYNPAKLGKDAGEIYGGPPSGIKCVATIEEILQIEADCVNYNGLSTTQADKYIALNDICVLLENGYNVTSSAIEFLMHPALNSPEVLARVDRACRRGNSSLYIGGINPGVMNDLLPITMTRVCRRVDRIHCIEICDMRHMNSPAHVEQIGFGLAPDVEPPVDQLFKSRTDSNPYIAGMRLIAQALDFEIDKVDFRSENAVSDKHIHLKVKTLEPGTVTVRKFGFVAWSKGREVIEFEFLWRVDQDVRPDWHRGDKYVIKIEGDPSMHAEIHAETEFDTKRPVSIYVAMAALNAVPTICEASPGLKNFLELPIWGGRGVTSGQ